MGDSPPEEEEEEKLANSSLIFISIGMEESWSEAAVVAVFGPSPVVSQVGAML